MIENIISKRDLMIKIRRVVLFYSDHKKIEWYYKYKNYTYTDKPFPTKGSVKKGRQAD
jgi:hypothetical protein